MYNGILKVCRVCNEEKDISLFVKNKKLKSGIDSICKSCNHERVKEWRKLGKRNYHQEYLKNKETNPDRLKSDSKKYYDTHLRLS